MWHHVVQQICTSISHESAVTITRFDNEGIRFLWHICTYLLHYRSDHISQNSYFHSQTSNFTHHNLLTWLLSLQCNGKYFKRCAICVQVSQRHEIFICQLALSHTFIQLQWWENLLTNVVLNEHTHAHTGSFCRRFSYPSFKTEIKIIVSEQSSFYLDPG